MKKLSLFLMLVAGCMIPVTAVAQDSTSSRHSSRKSSKKQTKTDKSSPTVEETSEDVTDDTTSSKDKDLVFTEAQALLSQDAQKAIVEEDYESAESFYKAMLNIRRFNLIHVQLAGVYKNQNKCREAYEELNKIPSAYELADERVPPEEVKKFAQKLRNELDQQCSAKILLKCDPADATIKIDSGDKFVCSTEPVPVVPGRHVIVADVSFGSTSVIANAIEGQTVEAEVVIVNYEDIVLISGLNLEALQKKSVLYKSLGYSFIGVGAAAAIGGGVLMYVSDNEYKTALKDEVAKAHDSEQGNEYDAKKLENKKNSTHTKLNASYGLVAGGGALLVTGIVLVIVDAVKIQPQIEELSKKTSSSTTSFNFAPVFTSDFAGFSLTGTF